MAEKQYGPVIFHEPSVGQLLEQGADMLKGLGRGLFLAVTCQHLNAHLHSENGKATLEARTEAGQTATIAAGVKVSQAPEAPDS